MAMITQDTVLRGGDVSVKRTPMARWNDHTFEVSPSIVRGFTDMKIKGGSDTKAKTGGKQKYVKRVSGSAREISMSILLHAYLGISDVCAEAMSFVEEATAGEKDYFYLGEAKLVPAKMMLTSAEVVEIVHYPGQGSKWISCKINVTFKQAAKSGGKGKGKKKKKKKGKGGSGGGSGGSKIRRSGGGGTSIAEQMSRSKTGTLSHAHQAPAYWVKHTNAVNKSASRASASSKNKWGGRYGTGK